MCLALRMKVSMYLIRHDTERTALNVKNLHFNVKLAVFGRSRLQNWEWPGNLSARTKTILICVPVSPCLVSPSGFITNSESSCTFALIAPLESSPQVWPWHEINGITKADAGLRDCILGMIIHADLTTGCATVFRTPRNMEKIKENLPKMAYKLRIDNV